MIYGVFYLLFMKFYVIGSEKWDHFLLNTVFAINFFTFQGIRHGLWTVLAAYFTSPNVGN
jgi:hypothetical protein